MWNVKTFELMKLRQGISWLLRGVTGGWAGWPIAHPVLGRIEGAAGQRRCAALLIAHPVFGSQLRPCNNKKSDLTLIRCRFAWQSLITHGITESYERLEQHVVRSFHFPFFESWSLDTWTLKSVDSDQEDDKVMRRKSESDWDWSQKEKIVYIFNFQ